MVVEFLFEFKQNELHNLLLKRNFMLPHFSFTKPHFFRIAVTIDITKLLK